MGGPEELGVRNLSKLIETGKAVTPRLFSGITWLFVAAHLSHHVITALIVPLLPFIRNDFKLDYTQAGLLLSAFTLSYGIAQLPAGWLADRLGPQKLITFSIVGVALAGFLLGLSHVYMFVIFFLILMGVAGGGYHPAAPALVSASVQPENRGFALGCHVIGGSASHFLSPLIGAYIATRFGWRSAFIGLAIPIILFGIVFHIVLGRRTEFNRSVVRMKERSAERPSEGSYLRPILAFLILSSVSSAVMTSTVAFIPLYMVDWFHVQEKTAAIFIAIIYSTGVWAAPLGGYLSDRLGQIPVILSVCFIAGPVIYLLNLVPFGIGFGVLLLLFGMVIWIRMPVAEAYLVGGVPERYRSTVLGIYYFCGIEGGGILTPMMGSLVDHFSFYFAFSIAGSFIILVVLGCGFFLKGGRRASFSMNKRTLV